MTDIRIYAPVGGIGEAATVQAPSPARLTGLRLVALDNGKPGAHALMLAAGEALAARTGIVFEGVRKKGSAATPCEDTLFEELLESADLFLTGTAD